MSDSPSFDRRDFLKLLAAAGSAPLLLPQGLGCQAPPERAFRRKTVHVDLSHLDEGLLADEDFFLEVGGARYPLADHTEASRSHYRRRSSRLAAVPDGLLTHYAAEVSHPEAMPCLRTVTGTTRASGRGGHVLICSSVHIPRGSLDRAREVRARRFGDAGLAGTVPPPANSIAGGDDAPQKELDEILAGCAKDKARCKALLDGGEVTEAILDNSDQLVGYWDTAKAIVFHHPEISSLDNDTAAHVMVNHIEVAPALRSLAYLLCCQGPAYEHSDAYLDGWAVLVPHQEQGDDGETVYLKRDAEGKGVWEANKSGDLIYDYKFSEITRLKLGEPLKQVLRTTKDDAALQDKNWQRFGGITAAVEGQEPDPADQRLPAEIFTTPTATADGSSQVLINTDQDTVPFCDDWGYKISLSRPKGSWHDGILVSGFETDRETRATSVWVMNWLERFLSVYLQFEDADGKPVPPPEGSWVSKLSHEILGEVGLETETCRFYGFVGGPPLVSCLPVLPPVPTEIKITDWPEEATACRIIFGGLGLGSPGPYPVPVWLPGAAVTAVVSYGIPAFILATGSPDALYETVTLKTLFVKNWALYLFIIKFVIDALADTQSGKWENLAGDTLSILSAIAAKMGAFLVWKAAKVVVELAAWIGEKLGAGELESSIPYAGWVLRTYGEVTIAAAVAETSVECLASDLVFDNVATSSFDIALTVEHDKHDYQFPATATHYQLTAAFSHHTVRKSPAIPLPDTTVKGPLSYTFAGVPAGGEVEVTAVFYSDSDWIAGKGSSGRVNNIVNDQAKGRLELTITIEEVLVPLTAETRYHHKQKLVVEEGARRWRASAAPAETVADLVCSADGNQLCGLSAITVSQSQAMLGYGWQSASGEVANCEGGTKGSQLHQLQNIALVEPETALAHSACGMTHPALLAYRLEDSRAGLWVDPRQGGQHVRPLDLAAPAFETAGRKSYGRFPVPVDGVALHHLGYAVGVSTLQHQLLRLKLGDQPLDDDDPLLPVGVPKGGLGGREGLLCHPVAVAVGIDGRVLVLEQGNRRVQAFDASGNSLYLFAGHRAAMPLKAESATVTYLDLGVEVKGFIYVLSYEGDGATPADYRLDIYQPDGAWLCRTRGVNVARLALDAWRNLYSLNYEKLVGPGGRTEPSVSEWLPSTPSKT